MHLRLEIRNESLILWWILSVSYRHYLEVYLERKNLVLLCITNFFCSWIFWVCSAIFSGLMNAMCETIPTYGLLMNYCFEWRLFITLCYLLPVSPPDGCSNSSVSQHSCIKSYSEDIFREAWLCRHMQGSLILPMFLWTEMCFVNLFNTDMTV